MSSHSVAEVVEILSQKAPPGTAEDWDPVGLLVGDPGVKIRGAVVSIDLTFEAIRLALQNDFKLIITHHPCIFPKSKGLSRVLAGTPVFEAIKSGISVAAFHTSFDRSALEVVQQISKGLGILPKGRLMDSLKGSLLKLVTFVPETHAERVRESICKAGAGQIGLYDQCTFAVQGEGSFRGSSGTHPFLGQPGQLERVSETRLETVFPSGMKKAVLRALLDSHPYEEVAYDFYPLEQSPSREGIVRGLGYGFWGDFPSPKPFSELAKDVKTLFNIHGFWITDPSPSSVTRVGFVAGKGASFVEDAIAVKCDLLITGEVGYHLALQGSRRGMAIMELGHRESEKFFVETMKTWLSEIGIGFVDSFIPTQKIWTE